MNCPLFLVRGGRRGGRSPKRISPRTAGVKQPIGFIVTGEYDELTALEDVFDMYKRIKSPREIWVYANEIHPMGPASAEWLLASLDWLDQASARLARLGPGDESRSPPHGVCRVSHCLMVAIAFGASSIRKK